MGQTFTPPVSLGVGIGHVPRVGPNGELFIAYWDLGLVVILKRSLDGGATFTTHTIATRMDVWDAQTGMRFPGLFRAPPLTYLAVDPVDATLYAVYFDTTSFEGPNANVDLYLVRSDDLGTTWTIPEILNSDSTPSGDQLFPWIEVDDAQRVHVAFLNSRHTVQDDNTPNGMFDNYYAWSEDGGATWSEHRLTPSSWNSSNDGLDSPTAQFVGDYLGLAVADNRVYAGYIDTSAGDPQVFVQEIVFPFEGDLNGDGLVDGADLAILLGQWGADGPADLNGDGVVDGADLALLLGLWSSVE